MLASILLIAIAVIAFFIFKQFSDAYSNQSDWPYRIIYGEESDFLLSISLGNIDAETSELPYKLKTITNLPTYNPEEQACISKINVSSDIYLLSDDFDAALPISNLGEFSHIRELHINEMCGDLDTKSFEPIDLQSAVLYIPVELKTYHYPFDYVIISLNTVIEGTKLKDGYPTDVSWIPKIEWSLNFPGWEIHDIHTTLGSLQIFLIRPHVYQIIIPALFFSLIVFILLIRYISDISALVQAGVGIIVSIWAIRQVIIPPDIQWAFIDPIFMSLYLFLGFNLLMSLFNILNAKISPADIPNSMKMSDIPLQYDIIEISPSSTSITPTAPQSPEQKSSAPAYTALLFGLAVLGFILRSVFNRSNDKNR